MKWRPIKTAIKDERVKDGLHVLLSFAGDPTWVCEGFYEEEKGGWWQANTHWTDYHDGQVYPTHWMHLPKPFQPRPAK